ncbi:MAG: hypothetical protein ACTSPB_01865 [Candidatus Thorarchaeota archaeon]
MNAQNNKVLMGVLITAIITVFLSFGYFAWERSSQAYSTAIQNRERIAVLDQRLKNIEEKLGEISKDVKTILSREIP